MKTVVVIPTYNEKQTITRIIEAVFKTVPDINILIVDDSSPDGTADIVRSLQEKFQNLKLMVRRQKQGLGRAYINAFEELLKDDEVEKIITMDADFSHDPAYLPTMIGLSQNFDMVTGSRYVDGGGTEGWELWRRILSRWGGFYSRTITRLPVSDCTAGFNLLKTDCLRKLNFSRIDASGYAFNIELKYAMWKAGAKIKEFPIIFKNRVSGESKMSKHIIYEGIMAPWRMIIRK